MGSRPKAFPTPAALGLDKRRASGGPGCGRAVTRFNLRLNIRALLLAGGLPDMRAAPEEMNLLESAAAVPFAGPEGEAGMKRHAPDLRLVCGAQPFLRQSLF